LKFLLIFLQKIWNFGSFLSSKLVILEKQIESFAHFLAWNLAFLVIFEVKIRLFCSVFFGATLFRIGWVVFSFKKR